MLEIKGGHDQAKYFLRTDVSKVLKKSRINCGESQICISRVNPRWSGPITRETKICDSPQLMPRMLEIIGGHDQAKYFLRTDVSKVLKKSRINCGESQIFVSRVIGPDHLGFTREIQICDSPQLMPRMLEIIGGHDQAKYFLRTDVSKVLKKSRINCGES